MNNRITFVGLINNNIISNLTSTIDEELCKVPYGKNVDDRIKADTLPYHFTLSAWNIDEENKVIKELSKIKFDKFKILLDGLNIMPSKENSHVLYFNIAENKNLKALQLLIYKILPSEKYNPNNFKFHITITIDKDYDKILKIKNIIEDKFVPLEFEVNALGLFEIYPAKLVKTFELGDK